MNEIDELSSLCHLLVNLLRENQDLWGTVKDDPLGEIDEIERDNEEIIKQAEEILLRFRA